MGDGSSVGVRGAIEASLGRLASGAGARGRVCLVVVGAAMGGTLVSHASGAGAVVPLRGVSYIGDFRGAGNLSFGVSEDRRRVFKIRPRRIPLVCEDGSQVEQSYDDAELEPFIDGRGVFGARAGSGVSIEGRFGRAGTVSGFFRSSTLIGPRNEISCSARLKFVARAEPRVREFFFAPVFSLVRSTIGSVRDGIPATASGLRVAAVAELRGGSLAVVNPDESEVRRIDSSGRVSTIKVSASGVEGLYDVAADSAGALLVSGEDCVRRVASGDAVSVVAGECISGNQNNDTVFAGDGGPATEAELENPRALSATPDGGFLVVDGGLRAPRIRRVAGDGTISTVAGNGQKGFARDGRATGLPLGRVTDIDALSDGGFLFTEPDNNRVRQVSREGEITTVAGTGLEGFDGDDGPATEALLVSPSGVAGTPDGGFLIADTGNARIRRVSSRGTITTVAGGGEIENGLGAGRAALRGPGRLTVTNSGSVYFPDYGALRAIPGPRDQRLLVALPARLADLRSRVRHGRALPVVVSRRCRLSIEVRRNGRPITRTNTRVRAGRSDVQLPRAFPRGFPPRGFTLRAIAKSGPSIATTAINLNPAPDTSEELPH